MMNKVIKSFCSLNKTAENYKLKLFQDKINSSPSLAKNTISHSKLNLPINVFSEFGNLKGVIVGHTGDTAKIPNDPNILLGSVISPGRYPRHMIEKAQQIQNEVSEKLMDRGIHVVRPSEYNSDKTREFEGVKLEGFHTYNARDLLLYYHNSVYESPTFCESRIFETEAFEWIMSQQREFGGNWYKAWKFIRDTTVPHWEAANFVRLGLDLLYQVSMSGSESGYWLVRKFL
jgi:hypothetical protein